MTANFDMTRPHLRSGLRRMAVGMVLAAVLAGASGEAAASTDSTHPQLFGTREVRSSNLTLFRRWTGMLKRYIVERDLGEGACMDMAFNRCPQSDWKAFLKELRGVDAMTQLDRVNRYVNNAPYISDPRNYSMPDYWATPREFLERGGDCEDYAIVKFMALRVLGWANGDLRIVVVNNLIQRTSHAVLIAYVDGAAWVLDNQIGLVVASERIKHLQLIFSLNEDSWWRHQR